MIETILVWIFSKVGIDFYKIKALLDRFEIEEKDGVVTIVFDTRLASTEDIEVRDVDMVDVKDYIKNNAN